MPGWEVQPASSITKVETQRQKLPIPGLDPCRSRLRVWYLRPPSLPPPLSDLLSAAKNHHVLLVQSFWCDWYQ
ncbi:hypothetical protein PGTUg99_024452 [Puccinia graminis f. sp. tritici]|uniref:Uncharacterized protein n=1 Tax=Puccinia graminis f. sp. tritici TaxID=56615 RepID=A0A5B0RUH0_PUCGR|nr:hypothetical protein PGTUg99_024452 [Puccinia graminis f. sp. tritici]